MHEKLPASQEQSSAASVPAPSVSIIIVSWNTCSLLRDLLRSLGIYAAGMEVIVVDNASSDDSVSMVTAEFPSSVLIRNASNLGYAHANNQGMMRARGTMLLLLGSDTRVIDQSIQTMMDYLERNPAVGAVSCRLLNPDGSPQRSCRRFPRLRDAVATYLSLDRWTGHYTMRGFDFYATQSVDQPAATCLMIRRAVIDQIGMFDERYSILYNDVDLCRRIRGAGWEIRYLGNAEVLHHGSQSTNQAPPRVRLEMYRNILDYYESSVGWHARLVLLPLLLVRLLSATRRFSAFGLLFRATPGAHQ